MIKKILFLYLIACSIHASEINPWVSLSTLWGQGDLGIALKPDENAYILSYNFVWEWDDKDFTYHEVGLAWRKDRLTLGSRYRRQLSQDEYAPYVSYFIPIRQYYLPMSLYNELEYRVNSVVKEQDYLRTRNIFSLYSPKDVEEKLGIRPYVSYDLFMDWDESEYEKMRAMIGYFIYLEKAVVRVYYIPWSRGISEESWDDNASFGATVIYRW